MKGHQEHAPALILTPHRTAPRSGRPLELLPVAFNDNIQSILTPPVRTPTDGVANRAFFVASRPLATYSRRMTCSLQGECRNDCPGNFYRISR